jgi:PAS domain S-box-containing protein
VLEGKDETLWLVAADLAARMPRSGQLEVVLKFDEPTNSFLYASCGYEDRQGRLWLGTANQGVYCWQDGKFTKIPDPKLDETVVPCLAVDTAGQIWVGTSDGLYCYDASLRRQEIPLLAEEVRALLVDRQGVLWIGTTGRGLVRYQHGRYEFLQKRDGLGNDYVNAIAEDREGSLWVGTRNGISRLSDVKFPIVPAAEVPDGRDALAVAPSSRGGVWIASSGGVSHFDPQTKTYAALHDLPKPYSKRVFEARNGDLYVVNGSHGLVVFSGGKAVALYTSTNMIVGLAEDERGVVASGGGELYRAGTNFFVPYTFNQDEKPPFYWINNLASGRDGAIWVASVNGIFRVKDGTCEHWPLAGLSDTGVLWVCEDQDGVVWAGLLSGIVRLKDNQARLISRQDGLFDNNIYSILPDDLGNLWVDSGRGIFCVTRQSLNDFADGKTNRVDCTVFDGINSVKVADKTMQERVGCKTADGRIWFPNPLGVVLIDPAHIPVNRVTPPVHIDRIRANGKEISRSADAIVPPGRGELEFQYNAPSFIAPQQVRFRYRLEGYDSGWVDAGNRRLAFYTNLKPGRYIFRVMAANADGIWNETGDTLELELRPHFYQAGWFYLLCGLAAFAALLGGYLWRIRRLEARQRALQQSSDRLEAEVQRRTAELVYEQQRLQFIFESMPVGVALARQHPNGRLERIINDAHLRICGLTREQDQISGIYQSITHPDDAARQAELGRQLDGGNGQLTMEKRYVRLDGRTVWVFYSFQRHHCADGSIEELTTVVDITERKLAEAKLMETSALLETLLENTTDAIYFKDLQSRFVRFSREMLKLFHLTQPGELTGKTDFDFFSEEHARPAFEAEQEIIRTGKPVFNLEEEETHLDGRVSWALTSKMPWRDDDGNIIGTMGISRDITERKRAETERERLVVELQSALASVKSLSGLLPICSGCKKIRDDKGYWNQVESYIQKHSEAQFSHGMCPDCIKKFYPDYMEIVDESDPPAGAV